MAELFRRAYWMLWIWVPLSLMLTMTSGVPGFLSSIFLYFVMFFMSALKTAADQYQRLEESTHLQK